MCRAASADQEEYASLLNALESVFKQTYKALVVWDFSMPPMDWTVETCISGMAEQGFLEWLYLNALQRHTGKQSRCRSG